MYAHRTLTVALAAVGAVAALVGAAPEAETVTGGRPNVVVIETDDQTAASIRVMPTVRGDEREGRDHG